MRRIQEMDGYLTTRGLAKRLEINSSTVYRFIYNQVIPPAYVKREPKSGVYLIRKDAKLIERLRQRVIEKKQKNGMLKSSPSA
jgi:DNA-binding transcriptional regulator YhcF (GntR family)